MKKNEVIIHGEVMVFKASKIPAAAKRIAPSNGEYHIVADSEVTGNHHIVNSYDGVEFFMDDKGTTFMKNSKPTQISCLINTRHTAIDLQPGCYEFGIQEEYDHYAEYSRKVRD